MNARRTTDGKGERFKEEEKNRYGLRMTKMRNDDEEEKRGDVVSPHPYMTLKTVSGERRTNLKFLFYVSIT